MIEQTMSMEIWELLQSFEIVFITILSVLIVIGLNAPVRSFIEYVKAQIERQNRDMTSFFMLTKYVIRDLYSNILPFFKGNFHCKVFLFSSRVCEKGTKCCTVYHDDPIIKKAADNDNS